MSNIAFTMTVGDYHHMRELRMGALRADGIDLTMLMSLLKERSIVVSIFVNGVY